MSSVNITCPRCAASVEVRYYGPCDECRTTLRRMLRNEARTVEREAFEPAMHVTPNGQSPLRTTASG